MSEGITPRREKSPAETANQIRRIAHRLFERASDINIHFDRQNTADNSLSYDSHNGRTLSFVRNNEITKVKTSVRSSFGFPFSLSKTIVTENDIKGITIKAGSEGELEGTINNSDSPEFATLNIISEQIRLLTADVFWELNDELVGRKTEGSEAIAKRTEEDFQDILQA